LPAPSRSSSGDRRLLAVCIGAPAARDGAANGGARQPYNPDRKRASRGGANIAVQIYTQATMTKMIAHCTQSGESIDQAIAWAADELEGFMRG
jgi:hypothetical protein